MILCCDGPRRCVESARSDVPEESMIDRRGFLSSVVSAGFVGAGAAASVAGLGFSVECREMLGQTLAKLPDRALYDSDEEGYWSELRKQFLIPPDVIYLNNGTVGSSPAPVLKAVFDA